MKTTPLKLLTAADYFAETTDKISKTKSGDRVALMTMGFDPAEKPVQKLMAAMIIAAKRGAAVHLNIDAHSFMIDDISSLPTGPLMTQGNIRHPQRQPYGRKLAILEELAASGGTWSLLNKPTRGRVNPFGGRSHIKSTVVNNEAYLGGCNLNHTWQTDMMVRLHDPSTVDWLYNFMLDSGRSGNVCTFLEGEDIARPIDSATTFFVDAGVKKQSLIYEQALELIDEASEWIVMTCQFFPGSRTARHLAAATKRGVRVQLYFNSPHHHAAINTLPMFLVKTFEQLRLPPILFALQLDKHQPRLHAKVLVTEKAAIIGSHNYVVQGVNFGTAETALLRRNAKFAQGAANFTKQQIGKF